MIGLTEDLVPHLMFPDKFSKQLLIDTGLVDNSGIPKSTPELDGLQQDRLGFLKGQIVSKAVTDAHGTKAWTRDFNVLKGDRLDHVGGFRGFGQ